MYISKINNGVTTYDIRDTETNSALTSHTANTAIHVPTDGTVGQVLTKTATGSEWAEGGGSGGTTDYTKLTNKPQINSVELTGNKSLSDLGIYEKPNTGIPKTDLDSTIQASLDKADNAIEMPSGGTTGDVLKKTADGVEWGSGGSGGSTQSFLGEFSTYADVPAEASGYTDPLWSHSSPQKGDTIIIKDSSDFPLSEHTGPTAWDNTGALPSGYSGVSSGYGLWFVGTESNPLWMAFSGLNDSSGYKCSTRLIWSTNLKKWHDITPSLLSIAGLYDSSSVSITSYGGIYGKYDPSGATSISRKVFFTACLTDSSMMTSTNAVFVLEPNLEETDDSASDSSSGEEAYWSGTSISYATDNSGNGYSINNFTASNAIMTDINSNNQFFYVPISASDTTTGSTAFRLLVLYYDTSAMSGYDITAKVSDSFTSMGNSYDGVSYTLIPENDSDSSSSSSSSGSMYCHIFGYYNTSSNTAYVHTTVELTTLYVYTSDLYAYESVSGQSYQVTDLKAVGVSTGSPYEIILAVTLNSYGTATVHWNSNNMTWEVNTSISTSASFVTGRIVYSNGFFFMSMGIADGMSVTYRNYYLSQGGGYSSTYNYWTLIPELSSTSSYGGYPFGIVANTYGDGDYICIVFSENSGFRLIILKCVSSASSEPDITIVSDKYISTGAWLLSPMYPWNSICSIAPAGNFVVPVDTTTSHDFLLSYEKGAYSGRNLFYNDGTWNTNNKLSWKFQYSLETSKEMLKSKLSSLTSTSSISEVVTALQSLYE